MSYQLGVPSLNLPDDQVKALAAERMILCEMSQAHLIPQTPQDKLWGLLAPTVNDVDACLDYAQAHDVPQVGFYQDQRSWDERLYAPRPGLIAMPEMRRMAGESDERFKEFMWAQYSLLHDDYGWTVLPVLKVDKAHPPQQILSVRDVCHNVILASELAAEQGWPGIVIFAEHRADVPPEVYPYLERLVSQVTVIGSLPELEFPSMASVTIDSYEPTTGPAPLNVRAVFSHTGDDVAFYAPRYRLLGGPSWMTAAVNPVSDNDHTYSFPSPATYEIGLAGMDANHNVIAETGKQRLVVVTAPSNDAETKALAQLDVALADMKAAVDNMHAVLGK